MSGLNNFFGKNIAIFIILIFLLIIGIGVISILSLFKSQPKKQISLNNSLKEFQNRLNFDDSNAYGLFTLDNSALGVGQINTNLINVADSYAYNKDLTFPKVLVYDHGSDKSCNKLSCI